MNEGVNKCAHKLQPLPSGGGGCKAEGKAQDRDHAPIRMKSGEAALLMVGRAGPRPLWEPDPPGSQ